jgi:hypothetical protein
MPKRTSALPPGVAPTPLKDSSPAKRSLEEARAELAALESGNKEALELSEVEKRIANLRRLPTSGTFRLTDPLYRQGVMFQPGDYVSIENEVPGRSWVRVEDVADDREAQEKARRLEDENKTSDVVALSEMRAPRAV